jgi:single-stranded-DNA-specific exonuclease
MKYRLRNNYPTNPEEALKAILIDRGVKDIEKFLNPSFACELNPYDLENIEAGVEMLLKHLRDNSPILFIVDCDADGFTSSAILWLYIKSIFPQANLSFRVHEHKQHGLSDMIDMIEDNPEWDLVICPDSASYDVKEHSRLEQLGIDCLILDHHEQLYNDNGEPVISTAKNTIIINN